MKKKALLLPALALSLSACVPMPAPTATQATQTPTAPISALEAPSDLATRAPELNTDPMKRSGDYYTDMGQATMPTSCPTEGFSYEGIIDSLGRIGTACGVITHQIYLDRVGHDGDWPASATPLGLQTTKNTQVLLPKSPDGSKNYRGYFYNKSHLIADSLGGDWTYENNIAGTRAQNVGNSTAKGDGGMRHPETMATEFIKNNPSCPVTYAATPLYQDNEIVPRAVEVNMLSCDGALNTKIVTYNDAAGWSIDYTTGAYHQN